MKRHASLHNIFLFHFIRGINFGTRDEDDNEDAQKRDCEERL